MLGYSAFSRVGHGTCKCFGKGVTPSLCFSRVLKYCGRIDLNLGGIGSAGIHFFITMGGGYQISSFSFTNKHQEYLQGIQPGGIVLSITAEFNHENANLPTTTSIIENQTIMKALSSVEKICRHLTLRSPMDLIRSSWVKKTASSIGTHILLRNH